MNFCGVGGGLKSYYQNQTMNIRQPYYLLQNLLQLESADLGYKWKFSLIKQD